MKQYRNKIIGWVAGLLLVFLRLLCRYRVIHDPRPALRSAKRNYIYAILHAHQLAAVYVNDDASMTAMVSRSQDGDLLVPALKLRRVIPVRGSSRSKGKEKGGRKALGMQADLLAQGVPALLAVDGPLGPRNVVHRGVADLALQTNAVVLPVAVVSSRRWVLRRTWDRFQIPKPFAIIRLIFGCVLDPASFDTAEALALAVQQELSTLEQEHDPDEAKKCRAVQKVRV